jgi:ligand-binding SRPBCC domain-containing protein
MPFFEQTLCFPQPIAEIFDFFSRPANWITVAPPELHLRLLQGPERIHQGAILTFKGRRWGLPQRVLTEVTDFQANLIIREEQRQGPLAKWIHTQHFEERNPGTRLREHVEYEPPRGLLGLTVPGAYLARDLETMFAYRAGKLRELLGAELENDK